MKAMRSLFRTLHRAGMSAMSLSVALAGTALLAACAGGESFLKPPPDPAEPPQIEAGSTLTLRVPLAFPEGTDGLYFQDSQLVSRAAITRDLPYCRLAPIGVTSPRIIQPTIFAVRSVYYDDRQTSATGRVINVTHLDLVAYGIQSYAMSCQFAQGGPSQNFLTSEQILGAIGAHFSMALQQ